MSNKRDITLPAMPARSVIQKLIRIEHTIDRYCIATTVLVDNVTGAAIVGSDRNQIFEDLAYTALMSANPTWAKLKPKDTFKDEDLFALADYMELHPEDFIPKKPAVRPAFGTQSEEPK